jgi:chemotaxis protein methyltransferase CheR
MDPTEEQVFDVVRKHLLKSRGVDLSSYSHSFVMRAIRKRVGRSRSLGYTDYIRLLGESETETSELLNALSINVTEFFRDKGAFEAFSEKAIRPLIHTKESLSGGIIRIWSAGCATGQETYTLAICAVEELKKMGDFPRPMVTVMGTDLSIPAINVARTGIFTAEQVKGVPQSLLSSYFVKRGDGYEVVDSIKRTVRFFNGNLLESPHSKFFDAVVCRNVMIYFSRQMHDTVLMHLHGALGIGGYMMLGKTETLLGSPRNNFETVDLENRIFRKTK